MASMTKKEEKEFLDELAALEAAEAGVGPGAAAEAAIDDELELALLEAELGYSDSRTPAQRHRDERRDAEYGQAMRRAAQLAAETDAYAAPLRRALAQPSPVDVGGGGDDAETDAIVAAAIVEAELDEEVEAAIAAAEEEEAATAPVELHVRRTDKDLLGLFSADGRFSRFVRNSITGHPKGSIRHRLGLKSGGRRRTRRRKSRKRRKRKRTKRRRRTRRRRTKRRRSTRGSRSKTHTGRKNYTTKRGDKVFHRRRHYVRRRRRPYTRHRRGGVNTFAETPAGPMEHQAIMQDNADKLLRYYACHAAGRSRDPLGPKGVAAARSAIMDTLKKYQCKIPELQMQLSQKYGGTLELTNDYCGQVGGRRRTRR